MKTWPMLAHLGLRVPTLKTPVVLCVKCVCMCVCWLFGCVSFSYVCYGSTKRQGAKVPSVRRQPAYRKRAAANETEVGLTKEYQ